MRTHTPIRGATRHPAWRRLLGAALLLAAAAAHAEASAADATAWPKSLRIGYQKFGTLIILKSRGDLERRLAPYGVSVTWAEFFAGAPIVEAMNAGGVDFGITGETPPVLAQAAPNSSVRYVDYEPAAPAGEAILVPAASALRSLADLRGKRIGVARGSSSQYLLVRALQKAGLQWSDVQVVYLKPADANAAFVQGTIDAWAIWDYYLAAAQNQSATRVLADGTGLVDNYAFFLARDDYLQHYAPAVRIALEEIAKVDAWTQAHPHDAAVLLAQAIGIDAAVLETALRRAGYGPRPLTPVVVEAQQRIADALFELKLLPAHLNVRDSVWDGPSTVARTP
jgi:sulfonate transport system substrate-binding protein